MAALAPTDRPTRWERRRWLTFLVAFVAILAPTALWALASPIGSIPDEPSHAIRAAAVARGQLVSEPWDKNPTLAEATVPENIANAHDLVCFAFDAEKTADCQDAVRDRDQDLVATGSSAGLNSPVFYALVGWPSLFLEGDAAFYGMRLAGAALCSLALAIMVMQLTLLARFRWAVVGGIVAITPMVLYLGGSINPNGLEAAAAGGLFATLLATFRGRQLGRRLWEQAGLALLTASFLLTGRSISLLWVLVIAIVAMLLGSRERTLELLRKPAAWALIGGLAVVGLLTVLWYVFPPVYGAETEPGKPSIVGLAFVFVFTLLQTVDFVFGMIGFFGWVDTGAPSLTIAAWIGAILLLLATSVLWGRKGTRWAVWVLLAVTVLVPAITQIGVYTQYGFIWQGRYMLAILVCLLIVAGLALDDAGIGADAKLSRFVTGGYVLLAAGQLLAFFMVLRRYIVGANGSLSAMLFDDGWEPPFGWNSLVVLFTLVMIVWVLLARRVFRAAPVVEPSHAVEQDSRPRLDA
ncbi:DUF2142 domain-containing protein [Plantibacter sp. CFBP 8798]|uniref:DUF2142 domain-containing protein n=1 Tax=Plantibacter sp. CFBP 8798 TaxID=2775268 RepID=UPI00177F9400|nr:DUF2142 domain-containing protein [Plantibacter sp. CFBP 8798]MBD8468412.1 DUF2142 domain-containing protein [Plantibacter sp. CFBP 8798]